MKAFRRFVTRLTATVFWRRDNDRIREELAEHLRLLTEEYVGAGMPPDEAHRRARIRLGLFGATTAAYQDEQRLRSLDHLSLDLQTTLRTLWRSQGFALTAIITLAIGLGVNIVGFSLLNAVRNPDLPYIKPERLVSVTAGYVPYGWTEQPLSLALYVDLQRDAKALSSVAAYSQRRVSFGTGNNSPSVRVAAALVSSNMWKTLGVTPVVGRSFFEEEDRAGAASTVIIGYRLWHSTFGGQLSAVGESVIVDGVSRRIVGIMPDRWHFPEVEDVWLPVGLAHDADPDVLTRRDVRNWRVVARLADNATLADARSEVQSVGRRDAEVNAESSRGWTLDAGRLDRESFAQTGAFFTALQAAALLVALLVSANLANLFLARAEARHRELAIRASLGAPRGRLVRLVLLESTLVAVIGATTGLVLSAWALPLTQRAIPEAIPFFIRFRIDTVVVMFAVVLSLVTAIVAGSGGVWRARRTSPRDALAANASTVAGSRIGNRARASFVFVQAAVAVALLGSALTLALGLHSLHGAETGQDWRRMLTTEIPISGPKYSESSALRSLGTRLVEQLRTVVGVEAAAISANVALATAADGAALSIEGSTDTIPRANAPAVESVSDDYLRATGMRLIAGRNLEPSDQFGAEPVVLINQEAQRRYFAGDTRVGRRLLFGRTNEIRRWHTVVGVVADTRPQPLDPEIEPRLYVPWSQAPSRDLRVTIRTSGQPEYQRSAVVRAIASLDPTLAAEAPISGPERMTLALWPVWFFDRFVLVFAVFAIVVTMLGVYGITRYLVVARRREIAVRIALGAKPKAIVQLLARHTGVPVVLGMLVGLAAAVALSEVVASVVPAAASLSLPVVAAVIALVGLTATVAVASPVHEALRVAPVNALRQN